MVEALLVVVGVLVVMVLVLQVILLRKSVCAQRRRASARPTEELSTHCRRTSPRSQPTPLSR